MHVAVSAERRARRLAEEVTEHVRGCRAAREVAGQLTVQRRDDIVRAECKPGARSDCLLSTTRVHRAWYAALPVQRHHAILEEALEQNEPEQLDALVRVDRRCFGTGLDRHQ